MPIPIDNSIDATRDQIPHRSTAPFRQNIVNGNTETAHNISSNQIEKRRRSVIDALKRESITAEPTFSFDEFCTRITCHGVIDWYESGSILTRSFWAVVLVILTAVLAFSVFECFNEFYVNPVITSIRVKPASTMEFPLVTICPANFVNRTSLYAGGLEAELLLDIFTAASSDDDGILAYRNRTADSLLPVQFSAAGIPGAPGTAPPVPTLLDRQRQIFDLSLSIDGFVRECAFQSKRIDCGAITKQVLEKDFGTCYQVDVRRKQSRAGSGLSLVLDLNTDEAPMDNSPLTDGVTVMLQADPPHPSPGYGILVYSGSLVQILVDQTQEELITVNRFSKTPQQCNKDADVDFTVLNVSYSRDSCQFDCLQRTLLDECDCLLPLDVSYLHRGHWAMENFCNKKKYIYCLLPMIEDAHERKPNDSQLLQCYRNCHQACSSVKYSVSTSYQRFPSAALRPPPPLHNEPNLAQPSFTSTDYLLEEALTAKPANAFEDKQRWSDNYIILDIAFADLETTIIEQSPAMTANTLIANLGGLFGLWLGASLFTILQFVIFGLRWCLSKLKGKRIDPLERHGAIRSEAPKPKIKITLT